MKYRKLVFIGMLILAFVFVYGQPIVYPLYSSQFVSPATQPQTNTQQHLKSTNFTYETIPSSGFANYIGKNFDTLQANYGEPVETISTGYSYDIHLYNVTKESGYMEVSTIDQKIVGIKLIEPKEKEIEPFKNGMTMNQLTKVTMIYPNFTMKYENQFVNIELSEEDMNYRPLIGFDNGSFVILFFDQNTSKLYSMMYLSEELLLRLLPYATSGEVLPNFVEEKEADWQDLNTKKAQFARNSLTILRKREQLHSYMANSELQATTNNMLADFLAHPEDSLTTQRVQLLQRIRTGQTKDHFVLNDEEMGALMQKYSLSQTQGYLELPVYDPTFTLLSWYSNSFLHQKYMQEKDESLGIAFSKENMLVLLKEKQNTSKESNEP